MNFKVGDVVEWCGAIGVVIKVYRLTIFCDFYQKNGTQYQRDMVVFLNDGKHKPYHEETTLSHAPASAAERFRKSPPEVSRGEIFR